MQVFLLTNVTTNGSVIGAFASEDAADRYAKDLDPLHAFTFSIREVPWFDNYGTY